MSNYTLKERMIAKALSKFPTLKKKIKAIYSYINYMLYKKDYNIKVDERYVEECREVLINSDKENFFGYYDKFPMNSKGWVISCTTDGLSKEAVKLNSCIEIILSNIITNEEINIGKSKSYNWQQGCRAHWLNDDLVIFNDFTNDYISKVYSVSERRIIKEYDLPVQDSFDNNFFLSLNYRRLESLTIDYGYNCLPILGELELKSNDNDGIFYVDCKSSKSELLLSLNDIINCNYKDIFKECSHSVNHIMINPNGKSFIFIHRYYKNDVRFDRLLYSDFKSIKVLVDENMVSHCCWLDENKIIGYFRFNNQDKYFEIDLNNDHIYENKKMSNLMLGDGHPNGNNNFIIFDSYPNKSRLQSLYKFDVSKNCTIKLAEFFNSLNYSNECRCDLHPRSKINSQYIFFDTVFDENKRKHYYIKLK